MRRRLFIVPRHGPIAPQHSLYSENTNLLTIIRSFSSERITNPDSIVQPPSTTSTTQSNQAPSAVKGEVLRPRPSHHHRLPSSSSFLPNQPSAQTNQARTSTAGPSQPTTTTTSSTNAQYLSEVSLHDVLSIVAQTAEGQLSPANCANGFYALGKMLGKNRHRQDTNPETKALLRKLVSSATNKAFNRNQSLKIYYGVATGRLDLLDERLPRLLKVLIDKSIRQANHSLHELTSQQITNLMMSLAKLGKNPATPIPLAPSPMSPLTTPSTLYPLQPAKSVSGMSANASSLFGVSSATTASIPGSNMQGKRVENVSLIRALAKEICMRGLREFNPRDISTMMWSLATLGDATSPDEQHVCALVAKEISARGLKDFTPQGVSNLLWSLATLEHRDDDFLRAVSAEVCAQGLKAFNEQDICNLIWSLAKLGKRDEQVCKLVMEEVHVRGLRNFNSQGIANLLSSFVKLGLTSSTTVSVVPPHSTTILQGNASTSSSVQQQPAGAVADSNSFLNLISNEIQKRGLRSFSNQAIASVAWSFGTAGSKDNQLFAVVSNEILNRGVKELSSQHISNLVLGYAKSGKNDDELFDAITHYVVHGSLRQFKDFTSQGISNLVWSFAKLERYDEELIICLVDEICGRGMTDFSSQAISTTIWSIAKVGRYYHKDFLSLVLNEVKSRGLKDFDGQDISNLLWSFATYGLKDEEFMNMVPEHIRERISESSFQSIVNIAWSFACLDVLDSPAAKKFFDLKMPDSIQVEYIDEVALQLHQCKLAWQQSHPGAKLPNLLEGLIGDGKWVDSVVNDRNERNESSSSHLEVSGVLAEMGFSNLQNEFVTPNGISVDILLPTEPGNITIEVDGPFHFLSDGKTPTGATMFKRRLLEGEGYKVYSVNVMKEWRTFNTKDEQKLYLKAMLENDPIKYLAEKETSSGSTA